MTSRFSSVALSESRCFFALALSPSPSLFLCCLSIRIFLLCSRSHILLPNSFVSLSCGCSHIFVHSPPNLLIEFFFVVLECHVLTGLFYPVWYLSSLPSIHCIFWFISSSWYCLFYLLCCFLFFRPNMFQHSSSVLLFLLVVDFLSAVPVEFSIQV